MADQETEGPSDANEREYRAVLALMIKDHITHAGLTPDQAARLFGASRRRMLELLAGEITNFGQAELFAMAVQGGLIDPQELFVMDDDQYQQFVAMLDGRREPNPGLDRLLSIKAPWEGQ